MKQQQTPSSSSQQHSDRKPVNSPSDDEIMQPKVLTGGLTARQHMVLRMQQTVGNQAVMQMINRQQTDNAAVSAIQRTQLAGDESINVTTHAMQPTMSPGEAMTASDPKTVGVLQRDEGENLEARAGNVMSHVLPASVVIQAIRLDFWKNGYKRALAHLDYYLSGAGGTYEEDVADIFKTNPKIVAHVGSLIAENGGKTGVLLGTGPAGNGVPPPIGQGDYSNQDWRLAIGNVDQLTYEIIGDPDQDGMADVRITLRDPYEWHPAEGRPTQGIHQVLEAQKTDGHASDFISIGTAVVRLHVVAQPKPNQGTSL